MKTTGNVASVLGRWLNTNRETRGIPECVVTQDKDAIIVSLAAFDGNELVPWPKTRAKVFANLEEEAGQRTVALTATFELGHMTVETHMRVNKGVFVIVLYVTYHDDSGRSNYLNREFFYRSE